MSRQATVKPVCADTPEGVLAMLESCNLTEEETEMLLTDAYALNRRLRAELGRLASEEDFQQQQPIQQSRASVGPASSRVPELPPLRQCTTMAGSDRLRELTRIYRSGSSLATSQMLSSRLRKENTARPASLARKEWQ